jgi:hypothetical protein
MHPYRNAHRRVKKSRGRASELLCWGCRKPAVDWSHIHGTDPHDPENYQPLCRKCHYDYDTTPERIEAIREVGKKNAGRKRPDNIERNQRRAKIYHGKAA